jgi:hypothetical protein
MKRIQRGLTSFFVAASVMAFGAAPAQAGNSSGGAYYSDSAVRGSLGVSLENLSLSNNLGKLVFLLNGGFALLSGGFACFAVAKHHRVPIREHDHVRVWRSGNSVTSN